MVKRILFSTLLTVSAALAASAAQPTVTYQINASEINSIKTSCNLAVKYTTAPATSVKVTTPENIKEYLDIRVVNGELKATVRNHGHNSIKVDDVTIYVSAPAVTEFEAESAGRITVTDALNRTGKAVEIEVSSAGAVSIASLTCEKLEIDASSAGNVSVNSCVAQNIEADASSAANITLGGVQSRVVEADASSAANVNLSGKATRVNFEASSNGNVKASSLAADSGSAEASSGGSVYCNVKKLSKETSTLGRIKNKN